MIVEIFSTSLSLWSVVITTSSSFLIIALSFFFSISSWILSLVFHLLSSTASFSLIRISFSVFSFFFLFVVWIIENLSSRFLLVLFSRFLLVDILRSFLVVVLFLLIITILGSFASSATSLSHLPTFIASLVIILLVSVIITSFVSVFIILTISFIISLFLFLLFFLFFVNYSSQILIMIFMSFFLLFVLESWWTSFLKIKTHFLGILFRRFEMISFSGWFITSSLLGPSVFVSLFSRGCLMSLHIIIELGLFITIFFEYRLFLL